MNIRVFTKTDCDAVVNLWDRCSLTVPWNDPRKDIERKLALQPELFLVGVVDEQIIGTAMGGYDGHRGWIYYLAIDPAFQNLGYGSLLVEKVEQRLANMGCPKINLMVRRTNNEVLRFYEQLGYQVDEVVGLGKRLVND